MFTIRTELALRDRTPYELALTLRVEGFHWEAMPATLKDRIALLHEVHLDPPQEIRYSLGNVLIPEYLLCSLEAPMLASDFGVLEFP